MNETLLLVRKNKIVARADSRSALIDLAMEKGVDNGSYDVFRLLEAVSIPVATKLDKGGDAEFSERFAREKAKA